MEPKASLLVDDPLLQDQTSTWWVRDGAAFGAGSSLLEYGMSLRGEVFREQPGRCTMRVLLEEPCFVKQHFGVGMREVWKNWLVLKKPIVGAENEFRAYRRLEARGFVAPRVLGYARSFGSQASQRSVLITQELNGYISLEELFKQHPDLLGKPFVARWLVRHIARFARSFHDLGLVHRDFYICHLLICETVVEELRSARDRTNLPQVDAQTFGIMDLHRALQFDVLPDGWRRRDLSALLFSTFELDFSSADWLRFRACYAHDPVPKGLGRESRFWQQTVDRARGVYRKELRHLERVTRDQNS